MNRPMRPLIVGAGPVGLGAALFLARAGISVRIVDMAARPSPQSKALAVNPRTLEILEPTGVTERMLAIGLPIRGGRFWRDEKPLAEFSFERLQHRYPFMLALSQATTERLLDEALKTAGVIVERGTGLVACCEESGSVVAELKHPDGGMETVKCPWLLAADGAHSTARSQMGVAFPGDSFPTLWHLADVRLATALEGNRAHIIFLDGGGFVFLVRVIDETSKDAPGDPLWRSHQRPAQCAGASHCRQANGGAGVDVDLQDFSPHQRPAASRQHLFCRRRGPYSLAGQHRGMNWGWKTLGCSVGWSPRARCTFTDACGNRWIRPW